MRKTTLLVGVVAGLALALLAVVGSGGGTALADGGPHVSSVGDATPDKCAGCHRIHTGQNEFLLKAAGTIQQFCYTCHGTGGAGSSLSVQNGTYYGTHDRSAPNSSVGLRAGGFEQARINTTDPTIPTATPAPPVSISVLPTAQNVNSAHAIDGTTAGTMWGNGAIDSGAGPSFALDCTSCHDPHGNGNYRILRTIPTGSGGGGYAVPDTYPKTATDYTVSNYFDMSFGLAPAKYAGTAPPPAGQSILVDTSRWCAQCHTRYLAIRHGPTPAESSREDSGDNIFTYRHTSAGYSVSIPTPAPSGSPQATPSTSYVNRACITCHAAHGSNAQMTGTLSSTVPWPGGSLVNPPNDTERASMLKMDNRGMCKKCHGNK
jgi:predicted CXXCH cytochrome family protein